MFRPAKQSAEFPSAIAFRVEQIARFGIGGTWTAQGTYAYCTRIHAASDADCRVITRVVPVYGPANA